MTHPFFTIGHSTRSIAEFIELLNRQSIQIVVDVRKVPHSLTNPQFDQDSLLESLASSSIDYTHIPELGGLRGRSAKAGISPHSAWRNQSFRKYADYAMTETFRTGLGELVERGHAARCAVMCAEALWWRCHRRIIADYLLSRGEEVLHILGRNKIAPGKLSAFARTSLRGALIYDVLPGGDA